MGWSGLLLHQTFVLSSSQQCSEVLDIGLSEYLLLNPFFTAQNLLGLGIQVTLKAQLYSVGWYIAHRSAVLPYLSNLSERETVRFSLCDPWLWIFQPAQWLTAAFFSACPAMLALLVQVSSNVLSSSPCWNRLVEHLYLLRFALKPPIWVATYVLLSVESLPLGSRRNGTLPTVKTTKRAIRWS